MGGEAPRKEIYISDANRGMGGEALRKEIYSSDANRGSGAKRPGN